MDGQGQNNGHRKKATGKSNVKRGGILKGIISDWTGGATVRGGDGGDGGNDNGNDSGNGKGNGGADAAGAD
ncbi:hypothetical protein ACP4OV_004746 [Aristida adscensionis]